MTLQENNISKIWKSEKEPNKELKEIMTAIFLSLINQNHNLKNKTSTISPKAIVQFQVTKIKGLPREIDKKDPITQTITIGIKFNIMSPQNSKSKMLI